MEFKTNMNREDFVEYLHEILSEYHKDNQIDLMPILQRAYSIIKEDAQINLNDDYKVIQKGKRVSICFDGRYYFLMSTINRKPFAPALKKEELMEDYKAIEENAE